MLPAWLPHGQLLTDCVTTRSIPQLEQSNVLEASEPPVMSPRDGVSAIGEGSECYKMWCNQNT